MNERISTNPDFISKVVVSLDAGGSAAGAALHGGDIDGAGSSGLISSTGKFGSGSSSSITATTTVAASSTGVSGSSGGNRTTNANVPGAFNL